MTLFILSYNPFEPKITAMQLLGWIKETPRIQQWYSPFLGTYFLKSNETLNSLTELFQTAFDGGQFVISAVHPQLVSGGLSGDVWSWVNADQNTFGFAIPAPPPAPRP